MKKITFSLFLLVVGSTLWAQTKEFTGKLYDADNLYPVTAANILNANTQQYAFSDQNGSFSITISENDTLLITGTLYKQLIYVANHDVFTRGHNDILMFHKTILLPEVRIIAMNPSYEGFLRDITQVKLPEIYQNLENIQLNAEQKRNATYTEGAPNVPKGTKIGSPITYLYNAFSKKMKMKRLYQEMMNYGDEAANVPNKYNRKIVAEITGLQDDELLEFMVFCRFSYYDLVRWSVAEIVASIRYKFSEYQYYKALQEDE